MLKRTLNDATLDSEESSQVISLNNDNNSQQNNLNNLKEPPKKVVKFESNVDEIETENNLVDKCIQVEEDEIDQEQKFVIIDCKQLNCNSPDLDSEQENQQDIDNDIVDEESEDDDDDDDFIIEDEEESDDSEQLNIQESSNEESDEEEDDDNDEIDEESDYQNVQQQQQTTENFDTSANVISTDSGESSSTITSTISNDLKKINSTNVEDESHCYQIIVDGQVSDVVDEGTNTEIEFNDENSSSSSSGVLSIANSLEDNTTVSSLSSESGQLRGLLKVETRKPKGKKKVIFNDVTVFYFKRSQGFTCVPSQGGSTLGMENTHSYLKNFTLESHAEERKRAHREILLRQKRFAKINKQSSTSESEDESYDDFSDLSDIDLENDSCFFLQPVPIKQRRALLRASGVRKIETREKEECRNIRMSREFCGCDCRVYCNPEVCSCHLAGIKCQVDRMSFPCGCTREGCANSNGRIEFNPLRVRTHFIHTIMRLEMEKKKQNPQSTSMTDAHSHQQQYHHHAHHQKNVVDGYLPTTSNGPAAYDSSSAVQMSSEQSSQAVLYHSPSMPNTDHHYLSPIHTPPSNQMVHHHYEMPMSSSSHHQMTAIADHSAYTSPIINTANCAIDQQHHQHQMFIANQNAEDNVNDNDFDYDSQDNNSSYSENSDYTNTSAEEFENEEQQSQQPDQYSASSSSNSNYAQITSVVSNSTSATVLPPFPTINNFNKTPQQQDQQHCHLPQTYQSSNLNHLSYNTAAYGEQAQQTYYDQHQHQQYEYDQSSFHQFTTANNNTEQMPTQQNTEYMQPIAMSMDISLSVNINNQTNSSNSNNVYHNNDNELQRTSNDEQLIYETVTYDMAAQIDEQDNKKDDDDDDVAQDSHLVIPTDSTESCRENSSNSNNENFSDIIKQSMVESAQA